MISSVQNEQVKQVVSLHRTKGRQESGEYLIEGRRLVQEAYLRGAKINRIYYQPEQSVNDLVNQALAVSIPVEVVSEIVMRKMSATEEPQGILAVLQQESADMKDLKPERDRIILILDQIQDPGNLGTILRTALAADVKQIILTAGTVDVHNPKVLRSTMGALFAQCIVRDKTPEEITDFCKHNHLNLAVSAMDGESIFKLNGSSRFPLALVIGNEAFGPAQHFLDRAQVALSIPMFNNVESLNAAMAAGIFLYELRRQGEFL